MKSLFQIFILLATSILLSCSDDSPTKQGENMVCGVKDPIKNLKWLNRQFKQFIGGPGTNGIILYDYNNRQVIEVQSGLFSSTNQHQYYCDGERLQLDDPIAFNKFRRMRIKVSMLYGTNMWN